MELSKTVLNSMARHLSEVWTMEESQEYESIFSEELQKEINKEILHQIFKSSHEDWYCVVIKDWEKIASNWCQNHLTGDYKCFGNYWYFELESDATLFALTWA